MSQPDSSTGAPTDAVTVPTHSTEPQNPTDPYPTEGTDPSDPTQPSVTEPAPTEPAPTEPTKPSEPPVVTDPTPALGSEENPANLVTGSNTASVPGKSGYWYTWKAAADGVLELLMPEENWGFEVRNLTAGDALNIQSNSKDESPLLFAQVSVLKGDELVVLIHTASGGKGKVQFTASFNSTPMGTLENPYHVIPGEPFTIRVPAGQTVHFAGRGQGTTLVIKNAADAVLLHKEQEYAPNKGVISLELEQAEAGNAQQLDFAITNHSSSVQIYTVEFEIPVGTFDNPETLTLGEHTVSISEDSQGYVYEMLATKDGTLTVQINGRNWYYQLYNLNSYRVEEGNNRDSSANPVSIEVKAGQVVRVTINTGNGKAADVTFTVSFA